MVLTCVTLFENIWLMIDDERIVICLFLFQDIVSRKASQFTGFAQHDAQEFMAFVLDGLHEVPYLFIVYSSCSVPTLFWHCVTSDYLDLTHCNQWLPCSDMY